MVSIAFRLFNVTVVLNVSDPDQIGELVYLGSTADINRVKDVLESQRGFYGHLIGSYTTPRDLDIAIASEEVQDLFPEYLQRLGIGEPKPFPDGATS